LALGPARPVGAQDGEQASQASASPSDDSAVPQNTPSSACPEPSDMPSVYVLENIEVRGNRRTASNVILRALPFHIGEPLDPADERLEITRYQLLGMGFFAAVEFSVERGSRRGMVALVVRVHEQNTLRIQELGLGVSEGANSERSPDERPAINDIYVGATISETNLLGTGTSLDTTFVLNSVQQGLRVRFMEPRLSDSPMALTLMAFFLNAREVYGSDDVLFSPPLPPDGDLGLAEARYALMAYHRGGGAIGTGLALGVHTRFSAAFQAEAVDVLRRPDAASTHYGTEVVPIDFHLHDRTSAITMVTLGLVHDERDDRNVTLRGRLLNLRADLAYGLFLSAYDFVRVQVLWREWLPLPGWQHTLRFSVFAGAALGDVPVFYRFYASDLTDLIPSRSLELNLDRRQPPNLLGTAIRQQRTGDMGGRIDIEYGFQIAQAGRGTRGVWGFVDFGVYGLADTTNFKRPAPGYRVSVPIDLTFDLGIRFETDVGFFQLALSTVAGFLSIP
jgi:outer membrane protein insertion porin family